MSDSTLRQRLRDGETLVGTFQLIDSPVVSEVAALAGLDFVIVDQEHGPLTAEGSVALCAAAERRGAAPVIRVRANDEAEIQRALDVGAAGVEVPQVQTRADAEAVVRASRYAPVGERGLSPYVRAAGYSGGEDHTEVQNERVTVIVHIEGESGVANLDEIAAVDGIDVLFLGPYDLSQSLGIPGQVRHDRVVETMEAVCDRAAAAGKTLGTYADDPAMARRWIDAGVQFVALYVDAPMLLDAFEDAMTELDR